MLAICIASLALLISTLRFGDSLIGETLTSDQFDGRNSELEESRRKLARSVYKLVFRVFLIGVFWMPICWVYVPSESEDLLSLTFLDSMPSLIRFLVALSALILAWSICRFAWHLREVVWALRDKNETSLAEFCSRSLRGSSWGNRS